MANRNWNSGRRSREFERGYERPFNNRPNPWQGNANTGGMPLPLSDSESTLSIASNIIANLLQQRQNMPSLLEIPPVHREYGNYDRIYGDRRPSIGRMAGRAGQGANFNRRFNPSSRRSGFQNYNKNRPTKKPKEGNKSDSKTDGDEKTETEETLDTNGEASKEGAYDDILPEFLHCHVCEKKMWDGRSFQNHINGRAHKLMMEKNQESYLLTADAMRQELKIMELKKGRLEKQDYYCAMCDLYTGDAAKHRLSLGHRRLKRYLHPSCNCCHKENANRVELDEHRLTPQHMSIMQNKSKDLVKPKLDALVLCTKDQELLHVRYPKRLYGKDRDNLKTKLDLELAEQAEQRKKAWQNRQKLRKEKAEGGEAKVEKGGIKEEGSETKEDGGKTKADGEEDQEGEKVKEGGDKEPEANGEAITEAGDKTETVIIKSEPKIYIMDFQEDQDLSGVTEDDLPIYDIELGYGKSFIKDYNCKHCNLCNRLFDTEETAEVHLRTWGHFKKYADMLRLKAGLIDKKETAVKRTLSKGDAVEVVDVEVVEKKVKTEEECILIDDDEDTLENGSFDVDLDDGEDLQLLDGEEIDEEKLLNEVPSEVPSVETSKVEKPALQETVAPLAPDEPEKIEVIEIDSSPKKVGRPRGGVARRGRN